MKFIQGHNSIKNVGGVMLLVLCTSPEYALYDPSFVKVSQRVSE